MQRFPMTAERLDSLKLRKLSGDTSYEVSQEIRELEELLAPYKKSYDPYWSWQRIATYAFATLVIVLVALMVYYQ